MKLDNNLNSIHGLCDIYSLHSVNEDIITSLLGQKLGSGTYRSVYNCNINENDVIKVEPLNTQCNVSEYLLWEEIKGLHSDLAWVKDWFAPVRWISPNGRILCMAKTVKSKKPMPSEVPCFLSDVKKDNFGWYKGRWVCHDYGFIYGFIKYQKKFKKISW